MNCYKCVHSASIPGDAHLTCNLVGNEHAKMLVALVFHPSGQFTLQISENKDVVHKVKGNHHGVNSGWCDWPLNFDPVWIEECSFYREHKND